ncbi:hypothetical protein [Streptomyces soliscabiei]|uniref:hypothetical protein n=1 Tax=Streptomyces soliscabiei TaxID=588897 RepID=UPI0029A314F5|nr:hypothetical protein [Streptomyces sp. NY05-11A]MDX2676186.1 hypothetical protein [Streptomyces sp. NY05-11A]
MTTPPDAGAELARVTADIIRKAYEAGHLTDDDVTRARAAMASGAVHIRRDDAGTIRVAIGSVLVAECHVMDLPSAAAEWEAAATG